MFANKRNSKTSSGFSIVELLVIIAVIGILATIVYVSYFNVTPGARDNSVLSDIDNMDAIQTSYGLKNKVVGKMYYSERGSDPDLDFSPSEGNIIDVALDSTDYCIRGYNSNGTKSSLENSFTKGSSPDACDNIPASAYARGIEVIDIGSQTWMKYNLNVGTMIPAASVFTNEGVGSQVVQKHCMSDNSTGYCDVYGGVYSWNEAMGYPPAWTAEGAQGICPDGFHVPSNSDFATLKSQLGGASVAGGKLKEAGLTHWYSPNTGATNESEFTALPAGSGHGSTFDNFRYEGYFWSSNDEQDDGYYHYLKNDTATFIGGSLSVTANKNSEAISVRCVGD